MSVYSTGFVISMLVILSLFFFGVYKGVQISNEEQNRCKSVGGVPLTERGIYKACVKPEYFIEIPK